MSRVSDVLRAKSDHVLMVTPDTSVVRVAAAHARGARGRVRRVAATGDTSRD